METSLNLKLVFFDSVQLKGINFHYFRVYQVYRETKMGAMQYANIMHNFIICNQDFPCQLGALHLFHSFGKVFIKFFFDLI